MKKWPFSLLETLCMTVIFMLFCIVIPLVLFKAYSDSEAVWKNNLEEQEFCELQSNWPINEIKAKCLKFFLQ